MLVSKLDKRTKKLNNIQYLKAAGHSISPRSKSTKGQSERTSNDLLRLRRKINKDCQKLKEGTSSKTSLTNLLQIATSVTNKFPPSRLTQSPIHD